MSDRASFGTASTRQGSMTLSTVLVVGGTGHVGRKVIAALCERNVAIRAMVRPGSDTSLVEKPGVTIVRGDMMDPGCTGPPFFMPFAWRHNLFLHRRLW